MILFIFEGKDDEPRLYKTLKELFHFELPEEEILHYFCNNIFSLYNTIMSYSDDENKNNPFEDIDIINVLKEDAFANHKKCEGLDKIKHSYEVSEIFLFFDYDIKPVDSFNKLSIEQQNERISMLLSFFNSTEIGTERAGIKLFINYPMIESYRYFKCPLPDENYKDYTVNVFIDGAFKQKVDDFCDYKNTKFLCYDMHKSDELKKSKDEDRANIIKQNWIFIKEMNLKKANFICTDSYSFPESKEKITQQNILDNQIEKYVNRRKEIAILNAFPLFWFEYIDETKLLT